MKRWIIVLVAAIIALAALWSLPWWVSVGLLTIVLTPPLVIVMAFYLIKWAIKGEFKRAFPELVPKETKRKLAAGESFHGNGFRFAMPVACEVQQTTIADFEAIILRPKIHAKGLRGDSMMIVSTIPRDEMKADTTAKLDEIFSKIEVLQASKFAPLTIKQLSGEYRTFSASNEGRTVRGESAYLGDDYYSIAWHIMAEDQFDQAALEYRKFARLIEKVDRNETPALSPS